MTNDTHDATGPHPCRLVVEPGDLFGLALGLPPDQRRAAIRAAMLMRVWTMPIDGATKDDPRAET
jgi:hypothetical protein